MYKNEFFEHGSNELNPAIQKAMRQNLTTTLGGALKSIYKSLEVRLEGENEDKICLYMPEMDAQVAETILKSFREGKNGNFWNALRAMGYTELILSSDIYKRSILRSEFVLWCRDYDSYLSELRKVALEISEGLKNESAK